MDHRTVTEKLKSTQAPDLWRRFFALIGSPAANTRTKSKRRLTMRGLWQEAVHQHMFLYRMRISSCTHLIADLCELIITYIEDVQFQFAQSMLLDMLDGTMWRRCVVLEQTSDTLRIHYMGWERKWDECVHVSGFAERVRPVDTQSMIQFDRDSMRTLKDSRKAWTGWPYCPKLGLLGTSVEWHKHVDYTGMDGRLVCYQCCSAHDTRQLAESMVACPICGSSELLGPNPCGPT